MSKNQTLALLLVSAFSTGASAAMVTVDAGHYSFSYDDSFWGSSAFSQSGDIFTFSNLGNSLGTSAAATLNNPYATKSADYAVQGSYYPSPTISITADSGYKLQSVQSGATGSLLGVAGLDPLNTLGSFASARVGMSVNWLKDSGGYWIEGTSVAGGYYETRKYASGDMSNFGTPGTFNISDTTTFSSNVTSVVGDYYAWGGIRASGKGSSASASQDTAYFNVAVAAVPEPETWAMLLAGLGVLGCVTRRRKAGSISA